jgi:diacylglycerol kinase family enzyme
MPDPTTAPAQRICVICNEGSGRNSREADAIKIVMDVLGDRAELRQVKGEQLDDAAKAAVEEDFDAVVAAGGDGTIMTVAGALMDSGRRFGVLPLGTFNYFARGLGIPEDPKAAAEVILAGGTRKVSLAEVNGQVFLNNISLGIYPTILKNREEVYARWGRRRVAAHWSAAKTFMRFQRPLFLTVLADGHEVRVRTPLLFVARSAYQLESFGLAGSDCVAEGRFAVFAAPDTGRAGMFLKSWRLVRQKMEEGRDFDLLCADEVTIAAKSLHLTVACDGEKRRMRTPLRLRVHKDALDVFAPPEEATASGEPTGAAA